MKTAFTLLFGCLVLFSQAQPCAPDTTITQTGIYPPTMQPAEETVAYSQVLQFRLPKDTVAMYQGNPVNVKVDSVEILEVLGMPPGLSYQCNPSSCVMPTSQTSCAVVSGTVPAGHAGHYSFKVAVMLYGRVFGSFPVSQADTIRSLKMDVNSVGMEDPKLWGISAYPNPSSGLFSISHAGRSFEYVRVYDANGKSVEVPVRQTEGRTEVNNSTLAEGLYLVVLGDGSENISLRMLKGTGSR